MNFKELPEDWPNHHYGGTLEERYELYLDCLDKDETPKTFEEWLNE